MEDMVMMTTVSAALLFSVALALLLEELIFGGLFRLFFGERPPLNDVLVAKPKPDVVTRARHSGL